MPGRSSALLQTLRAKQKKVVATGPVTKRLQLRRTVIRLGEPLSTAPLPGLIKIRNET
jgi:hypothetical protein